MRRSTLSRLAIIGAIVALSPAWYSVSAAAGTWMFWGQAVMLALYGVISYRVSPEEPKDKRLIIGGVLFCAFMILKGHQVLPAVGFTVWLLLLGLFMYREEPGEGKTIAMVRFKFSPIWQSPWFRLFLLLVFCWSRWYWDYVPHGYELLVLVAGAGSFIGFFLISALVGIDLKRYAVYSMAAMVAATFYVFRDVPPVLQAVGPLAMLVFLIWSWKAKPARDLFASSGSPALPKPR